MKNRLYPNKIASGFSGEASRSRCEEGCKEKHPGKGAEAGEWGRESHGKRYRCFFFFFFLLWSIKWFKAGVQKCIKFQTKPCC